MVKKIKKNLVGTLYIYIYIYKDSVTKVRCAVRLTEEFKIEVGLHQGSGLIPCLFAMVMDRLTDEVGQESPWTMMFADDIVICSESKEQCVNERGVTGRRGDCKELKFRRLRSLSTWDPLYKALEGCGSEVKRRVRE